MIVARSFAGGFTDGHFQAAQFQGVVEDFTIPADEEQVRESHQAVISSRWPIWTAPGI
jgi:hypothetical protein